jgi:hypothetical protein
MRDAQSLIRLRKYFHLIKSDRLLISRRGRPFHNRFNGVSINKATLLQILFSASKVPNLRQKSIFLFVSVSHLTTPKIFKQSKSFFHIQIANKTRQISWAKEFIKWGRIIWLLKSVLNMNTLLVLWNVYNLLVWSNQACSKKNSGQVVSCLLLFRLTCGVDSSAVKPYMP